MRLPKKSAKDIAGLINSITVAHLMIRDGHSEELWTGSMDRATIELHEKYGIDTPSLPFALARETQRKAA